MKNKIPDFESQQEEDEFWKTHNPLDYVNWKNAESFVDKVFKDKKVSRELIAGLTHGDPKGKKKR